MTSVRFFWPGFVVALLGLPLAIALLQIVPNVKDVEIVPTSAGSASTFVALGSTTDAAGVSTARKVLWQSGPHGLQEHDEIRLLVVTYGASLSLVRGEIRVPGTSCVFETPPGAAIVNTDYLALIRSGPCQSIDNQPHQLELTVAFRGNGRLGLATYFAPPAAADPSWLTLTPADAADPRPIAAVRGRYVDHVAGAGYRRIELLAYVWQVADSPLWIWAVVSLALVAVFVGTLAAGSVASASSIVRASIGVGCVGLGLALLYVVLVPPLQAPDEPDHMLDFAQVARRPALEEQLAALARRDHFERIHFFPAEHFRPIDLGHPFAVAWGPDVFAQPVAGRSFTTWSWWTLLAPTVQRIGVSGSLLALRLADAVVFALALALATALLSAASGTQVAAPHAIALALLLIPTLPFFATHVSEFALLTSAYVVAAAVIAGLFLDGDRVHWLGLPLGVAASCVLAGGRSGLPFAATFAAAIAGRALLGSSDHRTGLRDMRRSLIFWVGLAIGLALFAVLSTSEFRAGLWPGDAGGMPDWFRSAAELFRQHPSYIAIVIPLGLAAELVGNATRSHLQAPGHLAARVVQLACLTIGAGVVLSLVLSVFVSYPVLGVIETAPPSSAGAYATDVLKVAATGFRLGHHDWLMSASFWEGFGWLDTLPGDGLVSLLVLLAAVASVALLVHIARARDVRRLIWLGVLISGWTVTLILYAVSSYYLHRNVHGRYLVGLYLSVLATCASILALAPRARSFRSTGEPAVGRERLLIALSCGIHTYALRFILLRYF